VRDPVANQGQCFDVFEVDKRRRQLRQTDIAAADLKRKRSNERARYKLAPTQTFGSF
jgi:hypothetical protein